MFWIHRRQTEVTILYHIISLHYVLFRGPTRINLFSCLWLLFKCVNAALHCIALPSWSDENILTTAFRVRTMYHSTVVQPWVYCACVCMSVSMWSVCGWFVVGSGWYVVGMWPYPTVVQPWVYCTCVCRSVWYVVSMWLVVDGMWLDCGLILL